MFPANKGKSRGIGCSEDRGPAFGFFGELDAWKEPFNDYGACKSWSWYSGGTYNIGVDSQRRNLLTNQPSEVTNSNPKLCWFTISELEVWKVKMVGGEKKQK